MSGSDPIDRDTISAALRTDFADAAVWIFGAAPDYMIRVVSDKFDDLTHVQRERLIVEAIGEVADSQIALIEAFTVDELPYAPPLFKDTTTKAPIWVNALASTPLPSDIKFASDLDEDLEHPPVITFYGLRGGTGRSTALVATARELASKYKLRTLCIDMDLEAPALAALFGLGDLPEDAGVLAALTELEFHDLDITQHVLSVGDNPLLLCMPAGRLDATYVERLATVDVETWYREERNPLHRLLELINASPLEVDVILIDSRTGLSPVAGPLLFDVSDMAIIFFQPQAQAQEGTELLTRAMLASHTQRSSHLALTPEPRFVVSPMPPGPSGTASAARAQEWVQKWLAPVLAARADRDSSVAHDAMHVVPYQAEIAFRDSVGEASVPGSYDKIVDWIRQLAPGRPVDTVLTVADRKEQILAGLSFEASTAESQASLLEDFVITEQVETALNSRVPLIVGRKGTGKTALFRWLVEHGGARALIATAPNQYPGRADWALGAEGYLGVETRFADGVNWRTFWLCYLVRSLGRSPFATASDVAPVPSELQVLLDGESQLAAVTNLTEGMRVPLAPLLALDWLEHVSRGLGNPILVLFDGLDTAFGYDKGETLRRNQALSALVSLQAEVADRLTKLPFKIFVRQDIWEALTFQNKSHFLGALRLQLRWEEPADLYKVLLKQALRQSDFRQLVEANVAEAPEDVSAWTPVHVDKAWSLLIAERMRGEQTAFTWNWVWNRLADGNNDHSPRTLIQLMSDALRRERVEYVRAPYDRSVIRPRLLIPSLAEISQNALDALLREEFPPLQIVADRLRAYGRTPASADELQLDLELLELAADAGFVRLQEAGGRYSVRVPDLYRHALGVTRPGPA